MAIEPRKKQKYLKKIVKQNDIKETVKFLKENIEDEDIDFSIIFDTYEISEQAFLALFNDDGEIIKTNHTNLWQLLFNQKLKQLMIKTEPSWKSDLSDLHVKYVDFSLKYPEVDDAFEHIPFDVFEECFDGENLTDAFYTNAINFPNDCKGLIKNPLIRKGFSELEISLIKKCHKLDENLEDFLYNAPFKREDLKMYFDGSKMSPLYYKKIISEDLFEINSYMNVEKYYKYCNQKELLFIKLVKNNYAMINLCNKYNMNLQNIDQYFDIENQTLKLKDEVVKKALEEHQYDLLELLDSKDYNKYELTENQIIIINQIKEMKNSKTKQAFLEIIKNKIEVMSYTKQELDNFINILNILMNELENTNSKELHKFRDEILIILMKNPNPQKALELMNEIYTKNNLPDVGKAYLIFKVLHPNYSSFNFDEKSKLSPTLKNCKTDKEKDILIFSDLLKVAFGSNNRVIRDYLINIKEGNELFLNLEFTSLNDKNKETLKVFLKHLIALYNNTAQGKQKPMAETGNLINDLETLKKIFNPNERYNLPDRIVRSFGYFAGFTNFNEAWDYFVTKSDIADKKNRLRAEKVLLGEYKLEVGDFFKGIGDLSYFQTILQNGSVAKEFLSSGSTSDLTPLDTDLVRITNENETLENMVTNSKASMFGPIYFVLKNNDGITITKDENGNIFPYNSTNLEAFSTGERGHYGIRTGFASSEVDYIVIKNESIEKMLPTIKHIIVTQGFYIPVIDSKDEKLVFTPKEYDEMKKKMAGLNFYGNNEFVFSKNLRVDESIDEIKANINNSIKDATTKKNRINKILSEKFKEKGIEFKDYFDSDISLGNVQLIDTGSTGRGTQTGITSDFDFIMRIDSNMKEADLKNLIFDAFNVSKSEDVMKNVRLKNVNIGDDLDPIDLDISFVYKANTNFYSTDAALKDRLEQLKEQDNDKYMDVLANIILAKKVLKEAGAYKPEHARDNKEGGLGGVGVENWILQHNGSFYDAALSFVETAKNKSFQEFCENYKIWDYGYNYYTENYDEFVSQNMTKEGYEKMKIVLENYLKNHKVINSDNIYMQPLLDNSINFENIEQTSRCR